MKCGWSIRGHVSPAIEEIKLSYKTVVEVKIKKEKSGYIKGKVYLVTPNIAHGLIDSGCAVKYVPRKKYKKQTSVMKAGGKGKFSYKTK